MIPGQVIGRVVPNQVDQVFYGVKFLVVQPVDDHRKPVGKPLVACDSVGANVGEFVFMAQGTEAAVALPNPFNPADATIVAIIDDVTH
ncbi:MAG: hypothetical protein AMXMBFR84_12330 [Candidatus Hydrogenedentota bacterium]